MFYHLDGILDEDKIIIDVDCFIEINYAYLIILKLNQIIREY